MSIKISELPSATSVGDNDLVPIVQGGETKKAPASAFGGGGGGTSDYTDLSNKPSINSVTLTGDKTSGDLNLVGSADIATTIDSTSTNSQVAGAKAVYDKVNEVSFIKATHARQTITFSAAWAKAAVPVDTTAQQIGSDYSISNGVVVVGSKPKLVEISVNCAMDGITSGTYNIAVNVTRGGTTVVSEPYAFSGVAAIWTPQIYLITQVQEGDTIGITATKNQAGSVNFATTSLAIKTLSEVAQTTVTTNSTNTASLMNTGSLVGMGDRAEVTVEEKTVEVEPIETLKEEKESGDTI